MASTNSVFDQSQIGCHFFFDSVMGPYLRSAITRIRPVLRTLNVQLHGNDAYEIIQLRCLPRLRQL